MNILAFVAWVAVGCTLGKIFYTYAHRPRLILNLDLSVGTVGGIGGGLIYHWMGGLELIASSISAFLGAFIFLAVLRAALRPWKDTRKAHIELRTQPLKEFNK